MNDGVIEAVKVKMDGEEKWLPLNDFIFLFSRNYDKLAHLSEKEVEKLEDKYPKRVDK